MDLPVPPLPVITMLLLIFITLSTIVIGIFLFLYSTNTSTYIPSVPSKVLGSDKSANVFTLLYLISEFLRYALNALPVATLAFPYLLFIKAKIAFNALSLIFSATFFIVSCSNSTYNALSFVSDIIIFLPIRYIAFVLHKHIYIIYG